VFVVGLLIVYLAAVSPEFPVERFLVVYSRETLINEWYARGTDISEGVHSLGWTGQGEESWWKIGIVAGKYQLG
jgi:hypothetical protein